MENDELRCMSTGFLVPDGTPRSGAPRWSWARCSRCCVRYKADTKSRETERIEVVVAQGLLDRRVS